MVNVSPSAYINGVFQPTSGRRLLRCRLYLATIVTIKRKDTSVKQFTFKSTQEAN